MKITARVTPETAAKGAAAMRAAMQAAAELSRLGQQYPTGRMPAPADCPTCSGPVRRTTNMVCPTCGTDYAPETLTAAEQAAAEWLLERFDPEYTGDAITAEQAEDARAVVARVRSIIAAETLRQVVDISRVRLYTSPQPGSLNLDAVLVSDLEQRAILLEQEAGRG